MIFWVVRVKVIHGEYLLGHNISTFARNDIFICELTCSVIRASLTQTTFIFRIYGRQPKPTTISYTSN